MLIRERISRLVAHLARMWKSVSHRTSYSLVDFLIVFSVILILYLLTTSRRLTWSNFGNDGGDFWGAILTNGIPHPTGYPTYLFLGWLLQRTPFGDAYFKAVLLSCLPAALAAGLLCAWVEFRENSRRLSGLISGLLWGASPSLWSQATIIEVYALQAFFAVLALWWCTLLLRKNPRSPKWLYLLAFGFGLGAGNHSTQALMLPACLVCLAIYAKRTGMNRQAVYQLLFGLLGGLIYLILPLRASFFPPINWGNPQTVSGFLWEVSGAPYRSLLGTIDAATFARRLLSTAALLREQVGVLGIILGVIGGYDLYQKHRRIYLLSAWIVCIYLAFSIAYNTADSTGYLLPTWMIFCGWAGISLDSAHPVQWKKWRLSQLVFLVMVAWLAVQIPQVVKQIAPANRYLAADIAEKTLRELPANAIVLTYSEIDSFPLWAYHFGLGWRKDLSIIVVPLTQFQWYQETLVHTYPRLHFLPPSGKYQNSAFWGEQVGPNNPDHNLCASSVQSSPVLKIVYTCTDGTIISPAP